MKTIIGFFYLLIKTLLNLVLLVYVLVIKLEMYINANYVPLSFFHELMMNRIKRYKKRFKRHKKSPST